MVRPRHRSHDPVPSGPVLDRDPAGRSPAASAAPLDDGNRLVPQDPSDLFRRPRGCAPCDLARTAFSSVTAVDRPPECPVQAAAGLGLRPLQSSLKGPKSSLGLYYVIWMLSTPMPSCRPSGPSPCIAGLHISSIKNSTNKGIEIFQTWLGTTISKKGPRDQSPL